MTKNLVFTPRPSKQCGVEARIFCNPYKQSHSRYKSKVSLSNAELAKALERDLLKYEHELIALLGASALAEEQLECMKSTHVCPLCEKHFGEDSEHVRATVMMEDMYQRYLQTITDSKLLNKRRVFLLLMKEFKHKVHMDVSVSRSREKFEAEFVRGRTTALQEQKRASMELKKCLCCGSSLMSVGGFLKHVDYMLVSEERKLPACR